MPLVKVALTMMTYTDVIPAPFWKLSTNLCLQRDLCDLTVQLHYVLVHGAAQLPHAGLPLQRGPVDDAVQWADGGLQGGENKQILRWCGNWVRVNQIVQLTHRLLLLF